MNNTNLTTKQNVYAVQITPLISVVTLLILASLCTLSYFVAPKAYSQLAQILPNQNTNQTANLTTNLAPKQANANPTGVGTALLPVEKGGTGQNSIQAFRNSLGLGNTTSQLPIANGGTGNANGFAQSAGYITAEGVDAGTRKLWFVGDDSWAVGDYFPAGAQNGDVVIMSAIQGSNCWMNEHIITDVSTKDAYGLELYSNSTLKRFAMTGSSKSELTIYDTGNTYWG
ncbi:MAG: hypothetical protein LBN03_00815 [Bifidobacteriaceae bacterium]|jgi:hypothetical protein|nr:hypothetical protein [Bifidobacteriaceae bacterium]